MKSRKFAFVLGTRPEIIKLSPLIRFLHRKKKSFFLIHTGQHYSYEMDKLFFKELGLSAPRFHLDIRSEETSGHAGHTGRMMTAIEAILLKEKPDVLFVQGDTNSVLAGSLAASKLRGIKLGHVEAGLRSFDRTMPEEVNRVLSDHVSDFLFAPTLIAKKNLLREGIVSKKIFVTGNTIVDAVRENLSLAKKKIRDLRDCADGLDTFFLLTLHRQENVDHPERLKMIFEGLSSVTNQFKTPILFPIHPRTKKMVDRFGLRLPKGIRPVQPVGFLEFLRLEAAARMILTDSGGVQEEACILGVPCITIRTTTERPETILVGANLLVGFHPGRILSCAQRMMRKKSVWKNPFGDGQTSRRIVQIAEKEIE